MPTWHTAKIDLLRATLSGREAAEAQSDLNRHLEGFDLPALAADASGRYVAGNSAASQLTGYPIDALLQMTVADLTPVPLAPDARRLWHEFLVSGQQRGQYDVRVKSGRIVRVDYWAYADVLPGVHVSILQPVVTTLP